MKFKEVHEHVKGIPFISDRNAETLYNFILEKKPMQCLELGFAHGVATCYMAAALDEIGAGHLTSVDLHSSKEWQHPSIEELLKKTGLSKYVSIHRENTGYTWFLHDAIAKNSTESGCTPVYDFCIIDGPKNWTIDGCAFFLVDKLLKKDGWIVFDDYLWTYAHADSKRTSTDGITHRELSDAERTLPHIKEIFHLLVMQHPDYSEFKVQNNEWAWAHKVASANKKFAIERTITYKDVFVKLLYRMKLVKKK